MQLAWRTCILPLNLRERCTQVIAINDVMVDEDTFEPVYAATAPPLWLTLVSPNTRAVATGLKVEWILDRILDESDGTRYLVRWKGRCSGGDSWVPESHLCSLQGASKMIAAFEVRQQELAAERQQLQAVLKKEDPGSRRTRGGRPRGQEAKRKRAGVPGQEADIPPELKGFYGRLYYKFQAKGQDLWLGCLVLDSNRDKGAAPKKKEKVQAKGRQSASLEAVKKELPNDTAARRSGRTRSAQPDYAGKQYDSFFASDRFQGWSRRPSRERGFVRVKTDHGDTLCLLCLESNRVRNPKNRDACDGVWYIEPEGFLPAEGSQFFALFVTDKRMARPGRKTRDRRYGQDVEYLVRWYGYSSKDDTWEPPSQLMQGGQRSVAIDGFEAEQRKWLPAELASLGESVVLAQGQEGGGRVRSLCKLDWDTLAWQLSIVAEHAIPRTANECEVQCWASRHRPEFALVDFGQGADVALRVAKLEVAAAVHESGKDAATSIAATDAASVEPLHNQPVSFGDRVEVAWLVKYCNYIPKRNEPRPYKWYPGTVEHPGPRADLWTVQFDDGDRVDVPLPRNGAEATEWRRLGVSELSA